MRVMFTVAVLLTGIACISRAETQVCGGDCNRCLVYARGECIKRGADPACEALKKRCLAQRKAPMGAPKPATTAAPRPTVLLRHRVLCHRLPFCATNSCSSGTECCATDSCSSGTECCATDSCSSGTEIGNDCCSAIDCCSSGTDCCATGTDCCTGTPPRTCTSIFARRRHTATLNWCIWRRGPSFQTDAGKS